MHWLKKYWQAMAAVMDGSIAEPLPTRNSSLRVDIAGCRVYAPPVRQRQRALYIPRQHAAAVPVLVEGAESYGTGIRQSKQETVAAADARVAVNEFFTASAALADDVLFVPISPASVG